MMQYQSGADNNTIMPNFQQINWDKKKFILNSNKSPGKYVKEGFTYNSLDNKNFLSITQIVSLIKLNKHNFCQD